MALRVLSLTVGMAVDANVLIFERMREEWKVGKSISGSITQDIISFQHNFRCKCNDSIDSDYFILARGGPIRGFAVTLSAGILVSMFVVLIMTRLFFNSLADANSLKSLKMFSILSPSRCSIQYHGFGRKPVAILSILLIAVSWFIFAGKGDQNFGVDFTGGTVISYSFEQKQDIETVRSVLTDAGYPNASIV